MMLTTQIVNKTTVVMLSLFLSLVTFAQEKEIIYVKYDENREISDSLEQVGFSIKPKFSPSQDDYFVFYRKKNEKEKISFCKIKEQLITKKEAIGKFLNYLTLVSEKIKDPKERRMYFNAMESLPYFNGAFKKIYIYHIQSETLYEVSWESSIGCQ